MIKLSSNEIKHEVTRSFVLSQIIEPLGDKTGCTTRHVDSSPGTKLEFFLLSASNSALPILELVDRVVDTGGQPDCIFDIAYQAQALSVRNREGGKVNYAQILLLLPLITAQIMLYVHGVSRPSVEEIIKKSREVMRNTSKKDVEYLERFVNLSKDLSEAHHKRLGTKRAQRNPKFIGKYDNAMEAMDAHDFSDIKMALEIKEGYPDCKYIFDFIRGNMSEGVIKPSEIVHDQMLPSMGRPDAVADCIVVAYYFLFVQFTDDILFPC